MKATIDAAGRLVVPKSLRDRLGFTAGTELELEAVDGRLEVSVPRRVRFEQGPEGPRFVAEEGIELTTADVRTILERVRDRR